MSSPVTVHSRTYSASIADTHAQIVAAQRLRTHVFAGELGARLPAGFDSDAFDDVCDHLVIEHEPTEEIVGTYRLLPPGRAESLYSATEFDVDALAPLRDELIEAGRSCVHPDHRGGAVINLMWSALARYTLLSGRRYLAGCASVPLGDGGKAATSTWCLAKAKHLSPEHLRVTPHTPWFPAGPQDLRPSYAHLPPLLRGYLRLGAWVCGPPAHDPEFDVADFFVLLPMDRLDGRYRRYFLGDER